MDEPDMAPEVILRCGSYFKLVDKCTHLFTQIHTNASALTAILAHTESRAQINSHIHAQIHTYTERRARVNALALTRACNRSFGKFHTCAHAHRRWRKDAYTQALSTAYARTHKHTPTNAHTHGHTCTHTCAITWSG